MNNKTITIIHPSRSRPAMAFQTKNKWMSNALRPSEIEYILSVDNDDPQLQDYNTEFKYSGDVTIRYNNNNSAMQAINVVAPDSKGNLIVVVSDDFDCFEGWDE